MPDSQMPIDSFQSNPRSENLQQRIFFGPHGMRAGWRLLIFAAIVSALVVVEGSMLRAFMHKHSLNGSGLSPRLLLLGEGGGFIVFFVATWVMSKIEARTIADYGLPWREAFGAKFWKGIVVGFASITVLLLALWGATVFHFGAFALHGTDIWKYALMWAFVFLFVALFEEFAFRGYALFTLTTGIGFWPAALCLSVLFGYVHRSNSGENWLGAFAAGCVGFLFCLLLRRTGNLWMPVGFHAAWDWGETYFYGVPDSGQVAPGHLLSSSVTGPDWLTGGSVGPEGSWLCILLLVLLWCVFAAWFQKANYPNLQPAADQRDNGETHTIT